MPQKNFARYDVEFLFREELKTNENYDHNRAYQLLHSPNKARSPAKYKLEVASNGLEMKKASRFAKKKGRLIKFNDIERFYAYSSDPSMLILGCKEDNNRFYEFYKIKPSQVMELCTGIEKAKEGGHVRRPTASEPCLQKPSSQSTSSAAVHRRGSTSSKSSVEETKSDIFIKHHEEPVEQTQSVTPFEYVYPEHSETVKASSDTKRDSKYDELMEHLDRSNMQSADFKYIEVDPINGNKIVEDGSTYMFVAHYRCAHSSTNSENMAEPTITYMKV